MEVISNTSVKAVRSSAKGDSGRERLQLRKAKMTPEWSQAITKITGISEKEINLLHITDKVGSLIMLHPREMEGISEIPYTVRKLRGIILDMDRQTVVAHGDLLGTSSVQNRVTINSEGNIILNPGKSYNPRVHSCSFEKFVPHVNLRVFRWAGKTYIASHNTIDTISNNSRWGDHGIPFAQLLEVCGLENYEKLFPEGCMYSPHVHMFDICHPSLNICSFLKSASQGFIIPRVTPKAWYTVYEYMVEENKPIGKIPTAEEIGVPDSGYGMKYGKQIESPMDGPGFYNPSNNRVEINDLNKFLEEGYYDVPGPYGTGESIMVTFSDNLGGIDVHQIMSSAYSRRMGCIWKNDYNLYHSCIMHYAVAPIAFEDRNSFMISWPPYVVATPDLLEKAERLNLPPICIAHRRSLPDEEDIAALKSGAQPYEHMSSKGKAAPLNNIEDALNVIHSNLVYTASPYYLDLVKRSKTRFAVDVRDLIAFIQSMDLKIPADFPNDGNPRGPRVTIEIVLRNSRISAETSINKGQNTYTDKNGIVRHYSTRELINYYIASTVPKMDGTSLYRLIRTFRLYNHTTSLLITEPNARPKAIVEAEQEIFNQEYPVLAEKQEVVIPTVIEKEKEKEKEELNDDIYGPAAPTCSWANVASKPSSWAQTPNVVHTTPPVWSEVTVPVTPPRVPKSEPLPKWLTSNVSSPGQVSLPSAFIPRSSVSSSSVEQEL